MFLDALAYVTSFIWWWNIVHAVQQIRAIFMNFTNHILHVNIYFNCDSQQRASAIPWHILSAWLNFICIYFWSIHLNCFRRDVHNGTRISPKNNGLCVKNSNVFVDIINNTEFSHAHTYTCGYIKEIKICGEILYCCKFGRFQCNISINIFTLIKWSQSMSEFIFFSLSYTIKFIVQYACHTKPFTMLIFGCNFFFLLFRLMHFFEVKIITFAFCWCNPKANLKIGFFWNNASNTVL